uniref:Uncharacterized protein n=1 Tax=Arundo donax TaxID=35708 RepID=A0A0A9BRG7_ARUDO
MDTSRTTYYSGPATSEMPRKKGCPYKIENTNVLEIETRDFKPTGPVIFRAQNFD